MRTPKTQSDIVAMSILDRPQPGTIISEKVNIPGIESLHFKTRDEIAEVIVNTLKSRPLIQKISWEVGKDYIEISYKVV